MLWCYGVSVLVVSKWFDEWLLRKYTVVTEEVAVVVCIKVIVVHDVHVVVLVVDLHDAILDAHVVQDFLENSALVVVVSIDDRTY